jgi:hypothetical protein
MEQNIILKTEVLTSTKTRCIALISIRTLTILKKKCALQNENK